MKSTIMIVLCLMLALAGGAVSADDHIDNICQIPVSQSGWAGHCSNEADWQAGWYIYRKGTSWTQQNRGWLISRVTVKPPSVRILGAVEDVPLAPRNTTPRITKPLPTTKQGDIITTTYPHGVTVIALSPTVSIVTFSEDGSVVKFDHAAGTRTEVNGTTGDISTRQYK
ncbi:MAG: hypothetical protein OXE46_08790 [Chloroflexi bacterium]|nr:hypothetical protein [Chloroflexota bacterium]